MIFGAAQPRRKVGSVSDLDLPPCSAPPPGSRPQWSGLREAIDRVQWLGDTVRPYDGYPLIWCVESFYLGDMSALAAASLRATDARPDDRA